MDGVMYLDLQTVKIMHQN